MDLENFWLLSYKYYQGCDIRNTEALGSWPIKRRKREEEGQSRCAIRARKELRAHLSLSLIFPLSFPSNFHSHLSDDVLIREQTRERFFPLYSQLGCRDAMNAAFFF